MNQSDIFTGQLRLVSRLKYLFDPLGFDVIYKFDDRNTDLLTRQFRFVIASREDKDIRKLFDITGGGIDRLLDAVGEVEEFCVANNIPVALSVLRQHTANKKDLPKQGDEFDFKSLFNNIAIAKHMHLTEDHSDNILRHLDGALSWSNYFLGVTHPMFELNSTELKLLEGRE